MTRQRQSITMAAILFLSSGTAMALGEEQVSFEKEMKSCIATISDHADYDNASRVHHDVVELKNTFSGYVLAIKTDVFTASDEIAAREYSSYCVAKGDRQPSKFKINEINS